MSTLSELPQASVSTLSACHIQQDQVVAFSGAEQAWQVRSGTIALCRIVNGIKQCFFTAHAGEVIFEVPSQESDLVAIAIEPAVIAAIP